MKTLNVNGIPCETITKPLWWQVKGLMYTSTGYGKRIPTSYMVKYENKWRRVFCCLYSNVGTCYLGDLFDNLIVTD